MSSSASNDMLVDLNPAPEGQTVHEFVGVQAHPVAEKSDLSGMHMNDNLQEAKDNNNNNCNNDNDDSEEVKSEENGNEDESGSRLSMEGLLKQARISFEKWIDIEKPHNYPMPHGIVFLTTIKGSFGWGAEAGTGIVLYRLGNKNDSNNNDKNGKNGNVTWSGPCAIGSGGLSFGLQFGVSKVDDIIMLPKKHHVRTFTSKGQLKLGGSSELTVVNVGGKAQGSVNISGEETSDIHSYSMNTKGLLIGASVEGAVIRIRSDCNDKFYGKKTFVKDIANGKINIAPKANKDYDQIVELLNRHFKIYRPAPRAHPHVPLPPPPLVAPLASHAAQHPRRHLHPHPHPHPGDPIVGAAVALGVVGALTHGPHRPHGGHLGHGRYGRHGHVAHAHRGYGRHHGHRGHGRHGFH